MSHSYQPHRGRNWSVESLGRPTKGQSWNLNLGHALKSAPHCSSFCVSRHRKFGVFVQEYLKLYVSQKRPQKYQKILTVFLCLLCILLHLLLTTHALAASLTSRAGYLAVLPRRDLRVGGLAAQVHFIFILFI